MLYFWALYVQSGKIYTLNHQSHMTYQKTGEFMAMFRQIQTNSFGLPVHDLLRTSSTFPVLVVQQLSGVSAAT